MIRLVLKVSFLVLFLVCVGGVCRAAYAQGAIPAPSTAEILSATAYYEVLENSSGNITVLVQYEIGYTAEDVPAASIDTLLAVRVSYVNGDNVDLVSAQPFPYHNDGYGQGVVGFFLPDHGVIDKTTPLRVSIFYFPGGIDASTVSTPPTPVVWRDRTAFASDVVDALRIVERSWDGAVELLDSGDRLTAAGEIYAGGSVPYLQRLAPSLYTQRLHQTQTDRQEIGDSYAEVLQNTGGDVDWRTQFNSTADLLGQPVIMVSTFVVILLGGISAWFIQKISGSGLTTLPVMAIALAGGALVGWVHLAFIGILGFAALLVFAFVVILKRAG